MLLRKMGQAGRMLKPNRLIDKDYSSRVQGFAKSSLRWRKLPLDFEIDLENKRNENWRHEKKSGGHS